MHCSHNIEFEILGSIYFAGFSVGSLILLRFGDLYGRKRMCVVSNAMHIFSSIVILLSKSYVLTVIMHFWLGFSYTSNFVGLDYLSENVRTKDMPWLTSVILTSCSSTLLFACLWFRFISKDWELFYGVPIIFHVLVIFWMGFQEDGPKYYYGRGDYDMCRL